MSGLKILRRTTQALFTTLNHLPRGCSDTAFSKTHERRAIRQRHIAESRIGSIPDAGTLAEQGAAAQERTAAKGKNQ
jgi:hypothetical protein